MNFEIPKLNLSVQRFSFRGKDNYSSQNVITSKQPDNIIPVYGDDVIRTKPAQLSLFVLHDFHGQNIRMERAYTAATQFDRDTLMKDDEVFDKNIPVDKFKVASGDMFLGENKEELRAVNEFLNIAGIMANAVGNHECDAPIEMFAEVVKDRNYKLLGANMHPNKNNAMSNILASSFIVEKNGNRYGFIGIAPPDMPKHMKRPEDADAFNISDMENTVKDIQKEVDKIKKQGVNKIILLSHAGLDNEKYIAEHVTDIDIILGAHTHNLLKEAKKGENLLLSPKNEPVLIMQVGRDGEYIGVPNIDFDEAGKIVKIQYNVLKTDEFARSNVAKNAIESVLGKPEIVGTLSYVEDMPKDIYAKENPHCSFIADCMREELGTDIAIMNSANIRGKFQKGNVDTRDLKLISPFGNKMCVIVATAQELVNSMNTVIKKSMQSEFHRPGIFQVSGLRYEYSESQGKMTKLTYIDRDGKERLIDLDNPAYDKLYTIAVDDYCATSDTAGMNLRNRFDESDIHFDFDKEKLVGDYLRKQTSPVEIKSDGRIKVVP